MTDLSNFAIGTNVVNVSMGSGNEFRGRNCVSVGDGIMSRGNFKVTIGDKITLVPFPSEELMKNYIVIHQDILKTWKINDEDGDCPKGFFEKAEMAVNVVLMLARSVGFNRPAAEPTPAPVPTPAPTEPTPAPEQKGPLIEEINEPTTMKVASKE